LSLDPTHRLSLSRHADLKTRRDGTILVLPERAIRLGGSGAEILQLCDGSRSASDLSDTMRQRYGESSDIEAEVLGFLAEMLELGGIEATDMHAPRSSKDPVADLDEGDR
jgi:pyrroloquinoline quinone biosynthesis protein D